MRRLVCSLLVFVGLVGGASSAQALGTRAAGYWGCAGTRHVDVGVCVENPLPEELPLPAVPPLPRL